MKPIGYRRLLADNVAFRRLWLGDVVSFLGDWFNLIALYTSVQSITSTPLAIALVVAVKTVPNFVMIPFAGPIIDRFERRRLLLATDVVRAVCVAGLIGSHAARSLAGLYGFTFAMVCCTGIAFPAKKSVLPMLVAREHVGVANALIGGTWSTMLALGAALGGISVQWLGVTASLVIDGASFLVSAGFFWGLPTLRPPAATEGQSQGFIDGIRYLRRESYVPAVTFVKPLMSLANSVVLATVPLYGGGLFPGRSGPLWVGALYAARGAGATVGSLGLRVLFGDQPRTLRRLILVGYALLFAGLTLMAQASAYSVVAVGVFLSALGSGGNWVFSGTLLQLEADPAFHGRIFSLEFGVTTLALAAGSVLVGVIGDWGVPVPEITQWWAYLAVPPFLFWLAVLVVMRRQLRSRVRQRLAAAYAQAAEEPHLLARSRQYRYARMLAEDDDESGEGGEGGSGADQRA
jgi:MFS family permease